MTIRVDSGRLISAACALFAALFVAGGVAFAAPLAADLGPEVALTEPSNGFVGSLKVSPAHGPVGTPLTVTGEKFPPGQEVDLVWRTVKARWKVTIAEYF